MKHTAKASELADSVPNVFLILDFFPEKLVGSLGCIVKKLELDCTTKRVKKYCSTAVERQLSSRYKFSSLLVSNSAFDLRISTCDSAKYGFKLSNLTRVCSLLPKAFGHFGFLLL